jgi:hypothetical protein
MEAVTEKMIALSPPTSVREIAARGRVAIGAALTYIKSIVTRLIVSSGCRGGSPLCRDATSMRPRWLNDKEVA